MQLVTIADATQALNVPVSTQNNNCVCDGQVRLREALKLASHFYKDEDAAPEYVLRAVKGLQSWVDHSLTQRN
jgi:hypothetical protein